MRTTIKKGVTVRIIRLPTDGLTLVTESTLSLEERGKPIDGFTGRAPVRPRGCATPSWPACHPQISGGPHKAANDNGAGLKSDIAPCPKSAIADMFRQPSLSGPKSAIDGVIAVIIT